MPEGDEHRAYTAKPVWQRITVILAGPLTHFVVAYLIFAAVFFFAANWNMPGIAAVDPVINGQRVAGSRRRHATGRCDPADRRRLRNRI